MKELRSALIAAHKCNRVPVTALWAWENPDWDYYIYNYEADQDNLDPWTYIDGIDQLREAPYLILEFGTREKKVDRYHLIFKQEKAHSK